MEAWKKEGLSAAEASDIMAASVRLGNFDAEQLAPSLSALGGVAAHLGVEFHELAAAQSVMSKIQPNLSRNTTQLQAIFSAFNKPSAEALKILDGLGVSSDQLRQMLADKGLPETLEFLKESFGDNTEALTKFFGSVEAYTGFVNLTTNLEQTKETFDGVANSVGSADAVFGRYSDTLSFKTTQAQARWNGLMVKLGGVILPIFNAALNKTTDFLSKHLSPVIKYVTDNVVTPFMEMFRGDLKDSVDGASTGFLPKLGQVFTDVIVPAFQAVMPIIQRYIGFFQQHIIPLMIEVARVAIPLVANVFNTVLKPALDSLFPLWEQLIALFREHIGPLLTTAAEVVVPALAGVVTKFLIPAIQGLIPLFDELMTFVRTDVIPLFAEVANTIFPLLTNIVLDVVKPAISALLPVFSSLMEFVRVTLIPAFVKVTEIVLPALADIFTNSIVPVIKTITEDVLPAFIGVWTDTIVPLITDIVSAVIPPLVAIFNEFLVPAIQALMPIVSAVVKSFQRTFNPCFYRNK